MQPPWGALKVCEYFTSWELPSTAAQRFSLGVRTFSVYCPCIHSFIPLCTKHPYHLLHHLLTQRREAGPVGAGARTGECWVLERCGGWEGVDGRVGTLPEEGTFELSLISQKKVRAVWEVAGPANSL